MNEQVPEIYWFLFWIGLAVVAFGGAAKAGIDGHRRRMKALEILKMYAEKGVEPPAAVADPLLQELSELPRRTLAEKSERARHLERLAVSAFMAGAAAGVAWWRTDSGGEPKWVFYAAVIAAVAFAAGALAALVAALISPRK
jgi:hypothetical protein